MSNRIKKLFYKIWFWYLKYSPIRLGKHRLSYVLHRKLGPAIYSFKGINITLSPYEFFWKRYMDGNLNDPEVYFCIEHYLPKGGVFLDIGANMGVFSLLAAKKKSAKVLSFEPSYRELQRFHQNISVNPDLSNNITLIPYGLADSDKVQTFYLSPAHHSGMNSVLDLSSFTQENMKVDCQFTTLDAILSPTILNQINLCKIDVEGYEVGVLHGLEKSMRYLLDTTFVVEISPAYLNEAGFSKEDIYNFFGKWNFVGHNSSPTDGRQYNEIFIRQ